MAGNGASVALVLLVVLGAVLVGVVAARWWRWARGLAVREWRWARREVDRARREIESDEWAD